MEKLRISLKAYESPILDQSCQKILDAVKASGLNAVGPVPLPRLGLYCMPYSVCFSTLDFDEEDQQQHYT